MLSVEGQPSRSSIIHYINVENLLPSASESVQELYTLMESEPSPFIISKKGKAALDTLCKENPKFEMYKPFIEKTLSVRVLQKCKVFFKNMKVSKLLKMLSFFSTQT